MDIATDGDTGDTGQLISRASPEEDFNNDSGIDPDNKLDPDTPDNPELRFSDKASFREKSTSFLKVLEDSAKYRKLPEPTGKRPGRLEGIDSPRGVRDMEEDEDALISPRRAPPDTLRPLARAKAGHALKPDDNSAAQTTNAASTHKSRYSRYDDLPVTPRPRQPRSTTVFLPPVPGVGLMGAGGKGTQDRTALALSYSRQGNDILAKIRMSTPQTPDSPESPGAGRKRGDGNRISLDSQSLLSPRDKK